MTDDQPPSSPENDPSPDRSKRRQVARGCDVVPPRTDQLLAMVRFFAAETDRIIFSDHAQSRMDERGIFDADVYEVLRIGEAKGSVTPGLATGEWKVKIVAKPRGSRQIGVITIVIMDSGLFIKTVEWEDR